MNPSTNQENAHALVLDTILTLLRSIKLDHRPDFRTAGAAIEAHLLQLTARGGSSPTSSSRLAESDAQDP